MLYFKGVVESCVCKIRHMYYTCVVCGSKIDTECMSFVFFPVFELRGWTEQPSQRVVPNFVGTVQDSISWVTLVPQWQGCTLKCC